MDKQAIRKFLLSKDEFECFDIDVLGWAGEDGQQVSLLLSFPSQVFDEEGNETYIELKLEEVAAFCNLLQQCKDKFLGGKAV